MLPVWKSGSKRTDGKVGRSRAIYTAVASVGPGDFNQTGVISMSVVGATEAARAVRCRSTCGDARVMALVVEIRNLRSAMRVEDTTASPWADGGDEWLPRHTSARRGPVVRPASEPHQIQRHAREATNAT